MRACCNGNFSSWAATCCPKIENSLCVAFCEQTNFKVSTAWFNESSILHILLVALPLFFWVRLENWGEAWGELADITILSLYELFGSKFSFVIPFSWDGESKVVSEHAIF